MMGLLASLALAGAQPAFVVPPARSELRKAILQGLRPTVAKRLGPNLEFKVTLIRVQRDWAFVVADPQRRGGGPIDGRRIFGDDFENMDGLRVDAILRKRGRQWVVVDHAIGATDVWHCGVGPKSLKAGWGC